MRPVIRSYAANVAGEVPVAAVVAVADKDALVAGEHAADIDSGGPVPGVQISAGKVNVPQIAAGAGRGPVGVDRLRVGATTR